MIVTPPPHWTDLLRRHLGPVALIVAVLCMLLGFCAKGHGADLAGRWMVVKATAYCPCAICCGERAAGLTATGVEVASVPYGIAAHPRYLPYGSLILIPAGEGYLDRSRTDRVFRVDDTGGIIRRRSETSDDVWIDLRFRSHESAQRWGVRSIAIFVIDQ